MPTRRLVGSCLLTTLLAIGFLSGLERLRPEVLLVGNVTVDVVHGNRTVGGAVSYASAVLEALNTRACVVTTAGPEADLSIFAHHELHVVPDSATLTFAHSYTWWGHKRVLHVTARPGTTLDLDHVPLLCRLAKTVLIMPLVPTDVHTPSFLKWRNIQHSLLPQSIGLAAQGYQRDTAPDGKVFAYEAPNPLLLESLGEGVSVFLSDVESDPWSETDLMKIVHSADRLVITKGEKGADEYRRDGIRREIDAAKVEKVEDTNGAGDTFATAYMVAMASGAINPGWDASRAAAQIVSIPQSCKPWCIASEKFDSLLPAESVAGQSTWATSLEAWLSWPAVNWLFAPSVLNKGTES